MATYAYTAMDAAGKLSCGHLEAATPTDLEARLKRRHLDLLQAHPVGKRRAMRSSLQRRQRIEFCFHLEQLLGAAVPLIDALQDLRDSAEHARFRDLLAEIVYDVETGASLSQALGQRTAFDPVFVGVVAAGEQAGKLPEVLGHLSEALKWQDELAAQIKRLTLYPAFLTALVAGIFLFLLLYLVPKVAGFLAQLGQALPLSSRLLLGLSQFFVQHGLALAILLPAALFGLVAFIKAHPAQRDALLLRLPWLGAILRKLILARVASLLALMYGAGIPILDALKLTLGAVGNSTLEQGLRQAEQRARDGEGLAAAFAGIGLFPPLVVRMLRVGESTGALDTALRNVAYFYSRDARESIARMQVLMEPVLTVVVGALLGWVMLAVLGPVYEAVARVRL